MSIRSHHHYHDETSPRNEWFLPREQTDQHVDDEVPKAWEYIWRKEGDQSFETSWVIIIYWREEIDNQEKESSDSWRERWFIAFLFLLINLFLDQVKAQANYTFLVSKKSVCVTQGLRSSSCPKEDVFWGSSSSSLLLFFTKRHEATRQLSLCCDTCFHTCCHAQRKLVTHLWSR